MMEINESAERAFESLDPVTKHKVVKIAFNLVDLGFNSDEALARAIAAALEAKR